MKITKTQIREIIREELNSINEFTNYYVEEKIDK